MTFNFRKKIFLPVMTIVFSISFLMTGCSRSASIDLDTLYNANTTTAILEDHSSIYEEFTYYENLDDEVTFRTSYCYSNDSSGNPVYLAEGYDALDETSDDNFNYCIVNNIEYLVNYAKEMIIYPLTAQYIDDFKSNSFTVHIYDAEKLDSVKTEGSNYVITTTAKASEVYNEDTLKSLNALCNDTIKEIRTVYTADKASLHLNNVKMYYSGKNSDYLFSEEKVTYDTIEPDVSFADEYINPGSSRTVTVIEKTSADDISNVYTLPITSTPDFKCFESYYNYTLYNDAAGLDPYKGETTDAEGKYQNITLYAIPTDDTDSDLNSNADNYSSEPDETSDAPNDSYSE